MDVRTLLGPVEIAQLPGAFAGLVGDDQAIYPRFSIR
jgi:hypothetical protein